MAAPASRTDSRVGISRTAEVSNETTFSSGVTTIRIKKEMVGNNDDGNEGGLAPSQL